MAEEVLTWATRIPPHRLDAVRRTLGDIAGNPEYPGLRFRRLPMLHFASLVLFDEDPHQTDPVLVFEVNIDGPLKRFVRKLARVGRRGLDALYTDCDEYPGPAATHKEIVSHLMKWKRRPQLYHIGHPNRSVQEIRGDFELRRSITAALETKIELKELSPAQIIRSLRESLRPEARFPKWRTKHLRPWHPSWTRPVTHPPAPPTELGKIRWRWDPSSLQWLFRTIWLVAIGWFVGVALVLFGDQFLFPFRVSITLFVLIVFLFVRKVAPDSWAIRGAIVAAGLGLAVGAPFLRWTLFSSPPWWLLAGAAVVLLPLSLILLSFANVRRALAVTRRFPPLDEPLRARLRTLLEAEDQPAHSIYNHVAGLLVLKDDYRPIRWLRTRQVLRLLNLFYRTQYVKGKLVTIPSIHFAQWSLIDGRRLLFMTNYHGPADSYLDDFFDSLAMGVAFIWHDTKLFPHTSDPRRLKLWVRQGQTLAGVRYRSPVYEGLTVAAINGNTYIRERLLSGKSEASARRWLARFVTTPEEPGTLARFTAWLKEHAGVAS